MRRLFDEVPELFAPGIEVGPWFEDVGHRRAEHASAHAETFCLSPPRLARCAELFAQPNYSPLRHSNQPTTEYLVKHDPG